MVQDETIAGFLDALAAGTPAPGGGAAAALAAATGAAAVAMACRLTVGREKYRAHEQSMIETAAAAEELRTEALGLAADDIAAYGAVAAAYALPRGSDKEKAARSSRIQQALTAATNVPLRTAVLAARIAELSAAVVADVNPNAIGDLGVGTLIARAALDGAALTVRINLSLIHDRDFKATSAEQLEHWLQRGHAASDSVAETIETRL